MTEQPAPLLTMQQISKGFPGVQALGDVDLVLNAGECIGLMGENGAGKSTLMKILSGVYAPDAGRILIDGKPVTIGGPQHAQDLGISIIYQEFNLFPNLSVEENVFIGREPAVNGFVRRGELRDQTVALLDRLDVSLRPTTLVRELSVAQQQMVEIAKALSTNARIVIMDEPTSALTDTEVIALKRIIRGLREDGLGIVFISHRLEEILDICDRIVVLRDGRNAGEMPVESATASSIVQMMVGRDIDELYVKEVSTATDRVVLEVQGICRTPTAGDATRTILKDVSFQLRAGEIVGMAGLVGSGRTELARVIFGADQPTSGQIVIDGERVVVHGPLDAISRGIGLVPEDRKRQALVLPLTVRENISLAMLRKISRFGFVDRTREREIAHRFVDAFNIRTPGLEQQVMNLSGGNQQKVVLSRWLALEPRVLLVDEPTRGVDVGAKAEIHRLIAELAATGVAVLVISSELPEILAISDRILVMHEGRLAGELPRAGATQESIMALATGLATQRGAAA
jgi:ABC-type sugar transport system ATPase subunit